LAIIRQYFVLNRRSSNRRQITNHDSPITNRDWTQVPCLWYYDRMSTVTELQKDDAQVGTGPEAASGQRVTVHYTGWLYDASSADHKGRKFDSSRDRNDPFTFRLGAGEVIRGWDDGVAGMKVGGHRTLTIPSEMGYGRRGAGGAIPPDAALVFDVELLGVK
jgi:FKBP-type peptidyl-prolyl cis-trans isomerase FkpA